MGHKAAGTNMPWCCTDIRFLSSAYSGLLCWQACAGSVWSCCCRRPVARTARPPTGQAASRQQCAAARGMVEDALRQLKQTEGLQVGRVVDDPVSGNRRVQPVRV